MFSAQIEAKPQVQRMDAMILEAERLEREEKALRVRRKEGSGRLLRKPEKSAFRGASKYKLKE